MVKTYIFIQNIKSAPRILLHSEIRRNDNSLKDAKIELSNSIFKKALTEKFD